MSDAYAKSVPVEGMRMKLLYTLPWIVGLGTVLQGALNRRMGEEWGLTLTLIWNSILVLAFCFVLYFLKLYPGTVKFAEFKWWYFVPGLCGFAIITLIPLSISSLGASNTFLMIVASQLVISGLWDYFVEGLTLPPLRMVGAALALVGAWLASRN